MAINEVKTTLSGLIYLLECTAEFITAVDRGLYLAKR